jgi:SNF2 family DNA or RNA helicase
MDLVEAGEINLIIVDEGSEFRNFSTDRWKALHAVAAKSPRVWWLTGTPDPNGPEDIWAQAKIVNPRLVPDYFGTWRDRTMLKVGLFKYVPRKGYEKSIHEAMQPAIRFKKSEVMELPPVTYQDRKAEATKEQEAAVKQIKAQGTIASANGAVSAVNAAVLLGKILQIQAGVVKTDAGQLVHYPTNNRLRVLDEIVEQSNAKVIVFAPYKAVVDLLVEHLKKYTTVDFIDGRVTGKARTSIIQAFQGQEHPRVLVAHPKTTGHGLELSAADTVVWYAPFHSVDLYEQANNRIMSGLQKRSMGVFHIYMTTLEHKIFEGLKAGVSMQQKVLQLYDEEVLGKVLTRELTTVTI